MKANKISTDYGWFKLKKITEHNGMVHFKKIAYLEDRVDEIKNCFITVIGGRGVIDIDNNAFLIKRGDKILITSEQKASIKPIGHIKLEVYHN